MPAVGMLLIYSYCLEDIIVGDEDIIIPLCDTVDVCFLGLAYLMLICRRNLQCLQCLYMMYFQQISATAASINENQPIRTGTTVCANTGHSRLPHYHNLMGGLSDTKVGKSDAGPTALRSSPRHGKRWLIHIQL